MTMTSFDLPRFIGTRVRYYFSVHEGEGTLVGLLGDTALFDNASYVWIPSITKVEPWTPRQIPLPKTRGKIKISLEELEL